MKEIAGLKVEYVKPQIDFDEEAEHKRLLNFVTLFSQVGFRELCLNPNTNIKLTYSK